MGIAGWVSESANVQPVLKAFLEQYSRAKAAAPHNREPRDEPKPIVGNYVTRNQAFGERIIDLQKLIQVYIGREKPARPLNVLLAAPPGSGKSFLIKQILKSIKIDEEKKSFEELYIASLDTVSELYAMFQRVQSLNLEGKLPFVFFDEIDAPIARETVYAKFLAPMWDGNFYLGREKLYLGRSVFFFAGSSLSVDDASHDILTESKSRIEYSAYYEKWFEKFKQEMNSKKSEKVPDFVDRMDFILRIPPTHPKLLGDELQRLEFEDLAIVLIRKHFPKVNMIDKRALYAIVRLLAESPSRRSAEKAVFASSAVRDEARFDFECLPQREQEETRDYVAKLKEPIEYFNKEEATFYDIGKKPVARGRTPATTTSSTAKN